MEDVPMVNEYVLEDGFEKLVYRPANDAELADIETRRQGFAAEELGPIRANVKDLLAASDWTQLPDAPLTDEQRAAWFVYRRELRDYTDRPGFDPLNPPPLPVAPA